ncbi:MULTISPECIES: CS1 type fimbrial major subunit [Pseudomonas]|uniref:CS1 type fimbrial major subunit n=1 Tax=Pseudomonas TaxID=286 RepID=UPI000487F888|nr:MULTISPECIES: CS1 type fimbrial major subunit [Pseudomonas]PRA59368.1 fimbrial assembly protein [Pseudomonas sp. MYb115]QXN49260.1 fimbrial protein [Pseudomonas fluorescens]WSO23572.1 CS1 type fimbrial major subunit [Pseudomonas fluorescens]
MIKQSAIALCVGVMTCAQVFAAREERTFEVWVDIPTLGFYVIPAETNWIHLQQSLPWNINTSRLEGLRKNFEVKHDTSAIEARLEAEPYLSNGREEQNIYLRVSFNGRELSHDATPREVVSAAQAMAGGRFPLEIQPKVPAAGYKPGTYYGTVLLIFSAAAP